MCYPSEFEGLTREERLMEARKVRDHHADLYAGYLRDHRAGVVGEGYTAFYAHIQEHKQTAQRLREQRQK